MRYFILLLLSFSLILSSAGAQNFVQEMGTAGSIDWTRQVIRATGIGAPNPNVPLAAQRAGAIEAAKRVAARNLLEIIQGMNITSETTVRNAMMESDVIRTRVEGVLKGLRVVGEPRYMSDGTVEVDVEVPITGVLADILLPKEFGGGELRLVTRPLCPVCGQPWPEGKPIPPGVKLITPGATAPGGGVYTGLIVDARGLGVRPAMAPRILDENGNEVYGSRYVSREYAVEIGMVGYSKDINQARNDERVKDNPLIIKGLKASGPNKTDVVISNTDAALIHTAAATMNFLDHCRVMFVVD